MVIKQSAARRAGRIMIEGEKKDCLRQQTVGEHKKHIV